MNDEFPYEREPRARALAGLRRFGWNATSFQTLAAGFAYWFGPEGECVAYVDTGRAWVAAGPPVCDTARLAVVARLFVASAAARGRSALFFATERRAAGMPGFRSLLVGEQPTWDPQAWSSTLSATRSLREQLRRARAKGVSIERLEPSATNGAELKRSIDALVLRWLGSRRLPPMGFLVQVAPFSFVEERRLFVARMGGEIMGFAAVVPVYARDGWFVEALVRAPDAPNGTVEALVDAAMRDAASLGSRYLTLGLAPLAGEVAAPLRLAGKLGKNLYNFAGLRAFKAKFRPREWVPIFITHPREQSAPSALFHALSAFAPGGVVRYGLATLLGGADTSKPLVAAGNGPSSWFAKAWTRALTSDAGGSLPTPS